MITSQILQTAVLILIPALGGLLAERSGVLNIGLEGMIGFGAFAAVAVLHRGGGQVPLIFTVVVGMAAGLIPALIFSLFTLRYEANIFVVGLAINLLSVGALPFFSEIVFGTRGVVQIPPGLFAVSYRAIIFIALFWALLTWFILHRTVYGLRLRIAGEEEHWLEVRGIDPAAVRFPALLFSGASSGLAGALLALRIGAYLPGMTAGRGWIALVVIFLGYRSVPGLAAAAILFGFLDALSIRAQSVLDIPPTILLALPYLLTVVAFVTWSAVRKYSNR